MEKSADEVSFQSHEFLAAELAQTRSVPGVAERRATARKSIGMRAKVTVPGKSVLPAHTIDLSCVGASLTLPFELACGQECLIDLELNACGESRVFRIAAIVRYCVPMGASRFRAGVRFGAVDAAAEALIAAALGIAPH